MLTPTSRDLTPRSGAATVVRSISVPEGGPAHASTPPSRRRKAARLGGDHDGVAAGASAALRLADQLAEAVAAGTYPLGGRLPSERNLARTFGVSRTTVRTAIQMLAARGTLDVRDRSGTFVQRPSLGRISQALSHLIAGGSVPVSVRDLIEVRRVLEVEMAGLAAERRTQDDLREIGRALAETASAETVEDWAEADVAFHGSLARATGNPLFVLIYDALRAVLLEQRRRTGTALPATRPQSFRYHQRIFDRIYAGDGPGARRAMVEHLREARETMLRYAVELDSELSAVSVPTAEGEGAERGREA